ncbi:MAG: anti-sigma factor antagonist [Gemmataceae bacterium]|nr:anti-sigma factor antagonist [Gemmataceae bacterium]
MQRSYDYIAFDRVGEIFRVNLTKTQIEDHHMGDFGAELARLLDEENCKKMVLQLGPADPDFLVSVFLAKLINLQRRLTSAGGALALSDLSETTRDMFRIAGIEKYFRFYPDQQSAVQALNSGA